MYIFILNKFILSLLTYCSSGVSWSFFNNQDVSIIVNSKYRRNMKNIVSECTQMFHKKNRYLLHKITISYVSYFFLRVSIF